MSMDSPRHDEIEQIAYRLWQERGAPIGSPEVDWERAEQEVSAQDNGGAQHNGATPRETAPPGAASPAPKGRRGQRADHNS
jgi:hypothetical protein